MPFIVVNLNMTILSTKMWFKEREKKKKTEENKSKVNIPISIVLIYSLAPHINRWTVVWCGKVLNVFREERRQWLERVGLQQVRFILPLQRRSRYTPIWQPTADSLQRIHRRTVRQKSAFIPLPMFCCSKRVYSAVSERVKPSGSRALRSQLAFWIRMNRAVFHKAQNWHTVRNLNVTFW